MKDISLEEDRERDIWVARSTPQTLSVDEFMKIHPVRYPFLMVDKILDYEPGKWSLGMKCVSINELFFTGHFLQNPVMPGVLVIEALAQTGAVTILTEPQNNGKLVLLAGIKNALFKRQIRPGDSIRMLFEVLSCEGSILTGKAIAKVDGKVCVRAELLLAMVER